MMIGALGNAFGDGVVPAAPIHSCRFVGAQPFLADRSLLEYALAPSVVIKVLEHVPRGQCVGRLDVEFLDRRVGTITHDLAGAEALKLVSLHPSTQAQ